MSIPTPHIEAKSKDLFAKTVLMPGDPLRAKFVAETYLTDVVQINGVRNMFGYTGNYKGQKVTVMGSGMGMPSIGIYSYELFAFYGVEKIIRIGSCGSYTKDANVYDVIIVKDAYSESSFAKTAFGYDEEALDATEELVAELNEAAKELNYPVINGRIHSSDVFYRGVGDAIQSAGVEKRRKRNRRPEFSCFQRGSDPVFPAAGGRRGNLAGELCTSQQGENRKNIIQ